MNLDTPVGELPLVGPVYIRKLKKLDISFIENLLYHVPNRYIDFRNVVKIKDLKPDEVVTVKGEIVSIKNIYTKSRKRIQEAKIKDSTGEIDAIWFNQPFLIKTLTVGSRVSLAGKAGFFGNKLALVSPIYEKIFTTDKSVHTGRLVPVYPETAGVSSKWLRAKVSTAFSQVKDKLDDYLPQKTKEKLNLTSLVSAIKNVHFPKTHEDAEEAKKRLAFNEILFIQLRSILRKKEWQRNQATYELGIDKKEVNKFIKSLSFTLTKSQKRSIEEILVDLEKKSPMNRLLQGDVGSGKTIVAAMAAFTAFLNGRQAVFMAPTQILVEQHFITLKQVFKPYKIRVSLITSAGVKADLGKADIVVGTHALIYKKVQLDNVALVVIDEQHKFGVEQRAHLVRKSETKLEAPHVLTMTATPIPRSIALTLYGDLDLSTLDELPKGRKPTKTWAVPLQKRKSAYNWIREQIKKHQVQAFVVCPLIEESTKETMQQVKAATAEFENIKKEFPKLAVGLLHGRQTAKEKNKVVSSFRKKKIDILVSTPVVEVGIDIPNATIMVVEGADRFGLAQLHQLRGRVGRGEKESYCLLFTESQSKRVSLRLSALQKTISGFELAELDLKIRGPGEVYGIKQHGFSELKIASWQDTKLIKQAKDIANEAIENPQKFSKLLEKLQTRPISPN